MIISKLQFEALIHLMRKDHKRRCDLIQLGVDISCHLDHPSNPMVDLLLSVCLSPQQLKELEWWLYDSPNGIEQDPQPDKWAVITWTERGDGGEARVDLHSVSLLWDYLVDVG